MARLGRSRSVSTRNSADIWTRHAELRAQLLPAPQPRRAEPTFGATTILHLLLQIAHLSTRHPHATEFIHRLWAYITLAVTGIITEEATPLIGGLAAHDHRLRLSMVGLWTAGGTWVAAMGLYYVGRWRGDWARQRWPHLRSFMLRAFRLVRRHPWRCSLAVRWAYGLRLTLPIACGAARMPILIYAIGAAISCLTWSFAFTLLGWAFGRGTLALLGHVRRYENVLVALILIGLAIVFWVMRKRHVEDEVVEVLSSGDTGQFPVEPREEEK